MRKMLMSVVAVMCLVGSSGISLADEMGAMKSEMKGEMKGAMGK